MGTLIDSYFYSVLSYNASIWLTPELSANCKHDLLSVSSYALRTCFANNANDISFLNLHKHNKKSTPNQIMMYQLSLNLYALLNENYPVPQSVHKQKILMDNLSWSFARFKKQMKIKFLLFDNT